MTRDYLTIGSTPCDESCAQVGSDGYHERARLECKVFVDLIRRTLGTEPSGARLSVRSFPHDFGSYLEVICSYDESAADYAFRCESDAPSEWDDTAREQLHAIGICAVRGCDHTTIGCMKGEAK